MMSFRKKFAFFAVFFGLWQSLVIGVDNHHDRVFIYGGTEGYLFTSSYNLHTESEPNDLKVDMIVEYNMKDTTFRDHPWFMKVRYVELRFNLDGSPRKISVCVTNDRRLGIKGLDAVQQTTWFSALEKIANNIRERCCGRLFKDKAIFSKQTAEITSQYIDVKSLKNHKLHSTCYLDKKTKKIGNPRNLLIDVQEEMYHGKKQVVAHVSFPIKKIPIGETISFMKFVQTKNGIKPISLVGIKRSSIWYPTIKKEVQKSISRYLRLTRTHNKVTAPTPVVKVSPTSTQQSAPKTDEKQNQDIQNGEIPIYYSPTLQ